MLQITVPGNEYFDERTGEFKSTKDTTLTLEHSLVSLSKWESKWKKPFLDPNTMKTYEESMDYVRCMTITSNVDPLVYMGITAPIYAQINAYIEDSMTATWFNERDKKAPSREIITSELIYYWMIDHNIPPEYQKWHLNRLLTLIRVCNLKKQPKKKMSRKDQASTYAALNAQRRAAAHSKG